MGGPPSCLSGVTDGARTRDLRDHNQALCQLSYSHHVLASQDSPGGPGRPILAVRREAPVPGGHIPTTSPSSRGGGSVWVEAVSAAPTAFACSTSGPGCGTKTVRR